MKIWSIHKSNMTTTYYHHIVGMYNILLQRFHRIFWDLVMLNTMPMALGAPKPPQNLCGRYGTASSNRISMAPRAAKRDKSLAMIFLFLACVSLIFERRDGGFKALTLSCSTFESRIFFAAKMSGGIYHLHRQLHGLKCKQSYGSGNGGGFGNHSFVWHLEVHNFQLERLRRVDLYFFFKKSNAT